MKTKSYDGKHVRRILVGMVTDDLVCSRIVSRWQDEGLFESRWANLIGGWCVNHYEKHSAAPNVNLKSMFERWSDKSSDDDKITEAVERFLTGLSDTAESHTSEYLLDLADQHFNTVRMQKELKSAQIEIDKGMITEAHDRITRYRRIELGSGSYVEPAKDFSVWHQAFDTDRSKPLVQYPGDVGKYFGDAFKRHELYSWMGPDKTAKTTNMIDFCWRALVQRNRVAFFDAGDSSQDEVLLRLGSRIMGKPDIAGEIPRPLEWADDGELDSVHEYVEAVEAGEAFKRLSKSCRSPDAFRVECHLNSTLSVADVRGQLIDWEADDWIPDIVVVDYADIMAAPAGVDDGLVQIDETWKQLRRLSQEHHCLVMTATQSNAAAYGKDKALLSRANFSGRKTKLAHVNGMIGINTSDDERNTHQSRWNWVVRRKLRNRMAASCVHVAGCYDTESPVIISRF